MADWSLLGKVRQEYGSIYSVSHSDVPNHTNSWASQCPIVSKYPSLNKIFATFPRAPGWHNVLANSLYLVAMFSKLATLRGPVAAGSGIPSTPPHPHTPSRLRPQTSIASDVRSGGFEKKIDDILCKVFHLWDKYLQFDAIANTLEGEWCFTEYQFITFLHSLDLSWRWLWQKSMISGVKSRYNIFHPSINSSNILLKPEIDGSTWNVSFIFLWLLFIAFNKIVSSTLTFQLQKKK